MERESGGPAAWAARILRKASLYHRTSGVILSSTFVFVPYLIALVGPSLAIATFLSGIFAAYYGAFQLVVNHELNMGDARRFQEVVSPATGRRCLPAGLVVGWQWAAVISSVLALSVLAGNVLQRMLAVLCPDTCTPVSVSSWALIFVMGTLVVAVMEPVRQTVLLLQAIPGILAALLMLSVVAYDLLYYADAGTEDMQECSLPYSTQELLFVLPATALGVTAFVLGGHYLLPETLSSLNVRPGTPGVAVDVMECFGSSYGTIVLLYLPLGFLAYSVYGDCLQVNILGGNTPATSSLPGVRAAAGALLVVQIAVDILIREDSLHDYGPRQQSGAVSDPKPYSSVLRVGLQRVGVLLFCGVIAALIPDAFQAAGLAGGLFIIPIAFTLPALLSQATSVESPWDPQWLLNAALVTVYTVVSLIAATASTYLLVSSGMSRWAEISQGDQGLLVTGTSLVPQDWIPMLSSKW